MPHAMHVPCAQDEAGRALDLVLSRLAQADKLVGQEVKAAAVQAINRYAEQLLTVKPKVHPKPAVPKTTQPVKKKLKIDVKVRLC